MNSEQKQIDEEENIVHRIKSRIDYEKEINVISKEKSLQDKKETSLRLAVTLMGCLFIFYTKVRLYLTRERMIFL